jgi:hypothetical protein
MFTLYCDDSGTHPKSDIAVAACYISTVEQWSEFKRNWAEADQREHFGVFHMADFVGRYEQFASQEWADRIKRDRTMRSLINIIKTRARIGFAAAVEKSAYDEVIVDGGLKDRFGENHYAFAVRMCTALVDKWRKRHGYTEPVQYVFDRLSEGKKDINHLFDTLVTGGDHALNQYGIFKGCWSFQDKAQVVQLQAADIWAWENYCYMVDCFMPGKIMGLKPRKPRQSYLALIDSPNQVKYHVRRSLQALVKEMPDWAFSGSV